MDIHIDSIENKKKCWFSITGYRTLLILKSLMEQGRTIKELEQIVINDSLINKSPSKDTIRVAINTLKSAGCEIARPSKANAYKYELIKHPFVFNITDKEMQCFINLREKLSENIGIDEIFTLNDLYEKITELTCNFEKVECVQNSKLLNKINQGVLSELLNPKIIGKKIQITYLSPEYGEENLDIIPEKINYENGKIYLYCYIFKYEKNSLLNVERVLKVNNISISNVSDGVFTYEVIFEVFGDSLLSFDLKENEEIIEQQISSIKVKAIVKNEFLFIQRILLLGVDFKIISPTFFKEKLVDKIKQIQKGYGQ